MNPNPRRRNTEQDAHNIWLLLTKCDLSAEEIRRKLKMSKSSFMHARRKMYEDGRLGTIPGEPVLYTLIKRAGESAVQGKALAPRRKFAFLKHVVFMKG